MEELASQLEEKYGFTLYEIAEAGGRTLLKTSEGGFYLYTCPVSYRNKHKFIERIKQHIARQKNELQLLPCVHTTEHEPFFIVGDDMYYIQKEVRESLPSKETYALGEALAQFHLATRSFSGDRLYEPYNSLGSWPGMWRKKIRQYESRRDALEVEGGEGHPFDEYLLTSYTYVHQLADTSVQYLTDSGYQRMVKESAAFGKIAFQNFDDGFIVFAAGQRPHFGGEWNWVQDMRSRDIGQWIKAEVRRSGWNPEKIADFLEGYNSVSTLRDEEYAMMYALLLYPGRFFKLVEVYKDIPIEEREVGQQASWRVQLDEELDYLEVALSQFPTLVSNRFGAVIPTVDWLWRSESDKQRPAHETGSSSYRKAGSS